MLHRSIKILIVVLSMVLALSACAKITKEDLSGNTFVYKGEGFGGDFYITLNDDGTFQYNEGFLSSYIGLGQWVLDGDILTLYEDPNLGYGFVNRFRIIWGKLYYLSEGSDGFIYVEVKSGDQFKAK